MSANEDFVDQPEGQPLSPSTTFKASISSFAFSPSRTTRKRTRGALIDTTEPIASNDDDASSPGPSSPQKRPRLVSPQKKTGVKRPVADYSHLKGVTDYMKLEMDSTFVYDAVVESTGVANTFRLKSSFAVSSAYEEDSKHRASCG